ncbi:MAG TPA: phosphoribosyltransferase family protein [Cytophagaceae bacterium]|nr:phosphoribosyltransferase family protein [Cytophagaceae bacterium]
MAESNLILDKKETLQKIRRIAYQVYERNYQEQEIVVAGIYDKGYFFAELLIKELKEICPIPVKLVKITLDKSAKSQSPVSLDVDLNSLQNKVVVITDDVLNTGRTLVFSLQPFLTIPLKKLQTAVIVNRSHNNFPVSPDYIGYSLATTLMEHIDVVFDDEKFGVYMH